MGMYDIIIVAQRCPYCGIFRVFDAQTKDLDNHLWNFKALDEDWFDKKKKIFNRKFRQSLPVFPQFPFDKSHKVWKNQAEFIEARARIPKEFKKLKWVDVITDCNSEKCMIWARKHGYKYHERSFKGKIKIEHGFLISPIFDILDFNGKLIKTRFVQDGRVI